MDADRRCFLLAPAALLSVAVLATPVLPGAGGGVNGTVRARVQTRPGGPLVEGEMGIHAAPVDPEAVPAARASLDDEDLVLGVVADGQPMAYPIRYLALYEIVNDRVGSTPLAPSW